jgi:hypothetical protein
MKPELLLAALFLPAAFSVSAADLKEARITQIYNKVQTSEAEAPPRPAKLQETVEGEKSVSTGIASRAELTFADATLTRLGANTLFSFREGTRDLTLKNGTILLRVPKNHGGARIITAAVTAGITGTTVMLEVVPKNPIKFIVLEGKAKLYLNRGRSAPLEVEAGQMVVLPPNPKTFDGAKIVSIDIQRLVRTSALIDGMENPHGIAIFTGSSVVLPAKGTDVLSAQDLARQARRPEVIVPESKPKPPKPQEPKPRPTPKPRPSPPVG